MGEFIQNVQIKFKQSSAGVFTLLFRLFTGFMLGLTFTLAGQEIFGYNTFSFWLVVVCIGGVFLKISNRWSFGGVLIFNLVCVLVGMLLRMYVVFAPGS